MGKLIFITGGTRSGKSALAVNLAKSVKKRKLFIATCIPEDKEMRERVILHRKKRPYSWKTIEVQKDLLSVLRENAKLDMVIIIDCLTLFVSSLLVEKVEQHVIRDEVEKIALVAKEGRAVVIIVSNELGSGLVPENRLGRDFRDIVGFSNQIVAAAADEVNFMVSGIPLRIKGDTQ
ncbi:MAG: bifunctional adenosylcobinamide kinase/adenosylcobinamide-phosphate guanylyltransferase [Thermodesulfobacteriota bacterium]|nr:bifunctional adenosylcobinamide kinase/adenosylcobinamide-phosphate guanylyltransferase [Thermodesulfobacteriota bacterium]